MARKACRPAATSEQLLTPVCTHCNSCGQWMQIAYRTERTITTLQGICRLTLRVRRCHNPQCSQYHRPYRLGSKKADGPYRMASLVWM